jgi:NifU-like protein involved in Fe-S cluster formation
VTADPYSARVRALFASAAHAGRVGGGLEAYVEDQGVRVELTARVENGTLGELRFRAWGCPHLLAAAEAFCVEYEGREQSELGAFQAVEVMQTLPVPREKMGRILVLEDAVRSLRACGRDQPGQGKD